MTVQQTERVSPKSSGCEFAPPLRIGPSGLHQWLGCVLRATFQKFHLQTFLDDTNGFATGSIEPLYCHVHETQGALSGLSIHAVRCTIMDLSQPLSRWKDGAEKSLNHILGYVRHTVACNLTLIACRKHVWKVVRIINHSCSHISALHSGRLIVLGRTGTYLLECKSRQTTATTWSDAAILSSAVNAGIRIAERLEFRCSSARTAALNWPLSAAVRNLVIQGSHWNTDTIGTIGSE